MEPPAAAQCFLPAACEGCGATHLLQWSSGLSLQWKTVTLSAQAFLSLLVGVALVARSSLKHFSHSGHILLS